MTAQPGERLPNYVHRSGRSRFKVNNILAPQVPPGVRSKAPCAVSPPATCTSTSTASAAAAAKPATASTTDGGKSTSKSHRDTPGDRQAAGSRALRLPDRGPPLLPARPLSRAAP